MAFPPDTRKQILSLQLLSCNIRLSRSYISYPRGVHTYKPNRLCQQDVFATSLWQVCEQVVANTVVISSSCYKLVVVSLVVTCYMQAISDLLEQLVTSPMKLSTLLYKMLTICSRFVKQLERSSGNVF